MVHGRPELLGAFTDFACFGGTQEDRTEAWEMSQLIQECFEGSSQGGNPLAEAVDEALANGDQKEAERQARNAEHRANKADEHATGRNNTPKGIRTPVARMRTWYPRPLDDGGECARRGKHALNSKVRLPLRQATSTT